MKSMILILILLANAMYGQTKQDSVKLKTGSRATKATFPEKKKGKVDKYNTVYLKSRDMTMFVIAYDQKKKRYVRKPLPKNIEID